MTFCHHLGKARVSVFKMYAKYPLHRDQAKELKKMSRLLHYIASPLLFSAKRKNSGLRMTEDQVHFIIIVYEYHEYHNCL